MKGSIRYSIAGMALVLVLVISGCVSNAPVAPTQTSTPTPATTIATPEQTSATSQTPSMSETVQPTMTPVTVEIEIKNFAFVPDTISITKGTTVTWTQKDSSAHTIKGTGFESGQLSQGKTFSHTFNDTGTFNYICSLHPSMSGSVIVK